MYGIAVSLPHRPDRRTHLFVKSIVATFLLLGTHSPLSAALIALTNNPTPPAPITAGNFTLGYRFTVAGTEDLKVTSLGIWDDPTVAGLEFARQVTIWEFGGTPVLNASVTVPAGTASDQFISGFRFEDLSSSATLVAGQSYVIGFHASGLTIHPSSFTLSLGPVFNTTYITPGARAINGGGFSYPTPGNPSDGTPWEPNFLFSVVPEPSGIVSLLAGVGVLATRRLRSRNAFGRL